MWRRGDKIQHPKTFRMKIKTAKNSYNVTDLFGDLVNGKKIFFIQDAVSQGITKAPQQDQKTPNN